MPKETIGKTLGVAAGVCVVCSVFVSTAAVYLKPRQEEQKTLDRKRNILIAAGVWKEGKDLDELFEQIETRVIDISTGTEVGRQFWDPTAKKWVTEGKSPDEVDEKRAVKDPKKRIEIRKDKDIAGIKRTAKERLVYVVEKHGCLERIILPVYGKGLWSTMYGFLALGDDLTTIKSFAFYEHGETPGLGGEVDNPIWKGKWVGKKAFDQGKAAPDELWEPAITVIKGNVKTGDPDEVYKVDGLSGATLTARGVGDLVQFWLGKEGYGPFLKRRRQGGDHG